MPRNRSILIDNTLGRIFTNVSKSSLASASNLIAGSVPLVKTLKSSAAKTSLVPTKNLGGSLSGFLLSTAGTSQVLTIKADLSRSHRGYPVILNLAIRVGASYATSAPVATVSFTDLQTSRTDANQPFNVPANHGIFVDINYSGGTPSAWAVGLSLSFSYYAGAA